MVKSTTNPEAELGETNVPAAPQPRQKVARKSKPETALGLRELAEAILAGTVVPTAKQVKALAAKVLKGTKPGKAKKIKKAKAKERKKGQVRARSQARSKSQGWEETRTSEQEGRWHRAGAKAAPTPQPQASGYRCVCSLGIRAERMSLSHRISQLAA